MFRYSGLLTILIPTALSAGMAAPVKPLVFPSCKQNSTYCQVLKNKPNISKAYALKLATLIDKLSKEYNIKSIRLAAILAQESRYNLAAVNDKSKDYGISQINHKTIERYGFDKERLLTDLAYSVEAGAKVLSDFKRMYGHKETDYWTRYNSSNPERREEYKRLVARFM